MPAHKVFDMDFDEVSTVDVPANQHGLFVLAKRANPEETPVPDFFDADGQPIDDISDLEVGTLIQDANGNAFEVDLDDDDAYDGEVERELESVGKSAFFADLTGQEGAVYETLSEELRKAADDEARESVLAKAFALQTTELSKAQRVAEQAVSIAKAAEDRENERLYISKAAEFEVPISPDDLGPVLKRMAETMSYDDCAVINQVLTSSSEIFKQLGLPGAEEDDDLTGAIENYANSHGEELQKSVGGGRSTLSKEHATVAFFDDNPEAYGQLRRGQV